MKDEIKIQLVKIVPITQRGLSHFSPKAQAHLFPYTFHGRQAITVPTSELNSKKKIADFVWRNGGQGMWDVRGVCPNKKARMGKSMKTIVRVELIQNPDNFTYTLHSWKPMRLGRYRKILGWGDKSVF